MIGLLAQLAACGGADGGGDAAPAIDAPAALADATPDATPAPLTLDERRAALFADNPDLGVGETMCARWNSLDDSRKAVFLTLTHRLDRASTPDGSTMLAHMTRLWAILGGGADGTACGDAENNRLFLSMDIYLWEQMVAIADGASIDIGDGGGGRWAPTSDLAGPHEPFDASDETESGLRCAVIIELPDSRPPTAQAHFFRAGSAVPVQRGPAIDLPLDPTMLEIDHDFDCLHRSNPLCPGRDFDAKYIANYGDFDCAWVPPTCTATEQGCYPAVAP